ncbi:MAG: membrane protein insertion efficiency factor YidD [Fibrobacterota bacterium]
MKKTPGFMPGVFLLLWTLSCYAQTELAVGLFQDGDWTACKRECLRILVNQPSNEAALSLLDKVKTAERAGAKTKQSRLTSKPGEWIVFSYRGLIRPAIGSRCSLTPGCSEYFLQASRKHGLLAIPMAADRLIREPSVVLNHEHEVIVGHDIRIADPLSDHDQWIE